MKNYRLNQLDGLRGLFCLMVILTHFPFRDSVLVSNFIVRQGYLFVDFFFVLSGFVIAFNYYDSIISSATFKDYLRKRFLRLYPLLLYTVFIYLAFEVFFVLYFPSLLTHRETIAHLCYLTLDSLTFLNSTVLIGDNLGMNYPTWSISAEMIAYIVFGLAILLAGRKKKWVLSAVLVICMSFLWYKKMYLLEGDWGFMRGIICFTMGVFSFLAFRKYGQRNFPRLPEYIAPIVLVAMFYFRNRYFEMNGLFVQRELFTLAFVPLFFAAFVFIYALSNGYVVDLLCSRFFQYIGKLSYSIYLNHAIVLIIVVRGMFSLLKMEETQFTIAISLLLSLVLTILYSAITFRFVENKGKKLLMKFLNLK